MVGDGAFAFADEGALAAGAVDDGGGGVVAEAAVDEEVDAGGEELVDEFGVGEILGVLVLVEHADGSADEGGAQFLNDGACDVVVGDANADGFVGIEVVAWDVVVGVEDEGVGTGEAGTEELEGVLVERAKVFGGLAEGVEEEGVVGVLEGVVLELGYGLDRLFELHAADEGVEGVGGDDGDGALVEGVDDLADVAWVWVVVV